jgi:hypothetical protein
MSLIDLFRQDPLSMFDEDEGTDLALHVRQCNRRYKAMSSKQTVTLVLVTALFIVQALDLDLKEIITSLLK